MMWWNHGFWGSGWGWSLFAIMAVAMVACMAMMTRMMMRHGASQPAWETGDRDQEPGQILARRLASGEIDAEEFKRLRDALQPPGPRPADAAEPGGAGRHSPQPGQGVL